MLFMAVSVCFAALILVFPEASLAGASSALQNWMLNVLPSLLPFFMAASLLRTSGAAAKLARIMSPLTRRLGYPPAFAYAFTVSLLTGSPSGAAAVCASYREEGFSESHARRMLNAAFNASPLFMTVRASPSPSRLPKALQFNPMRSATSWAMPPSTPHWRQWKTPTPLRTLPPL